MNCGFPLGAFLHSTIKLAVENQPPDLFQPHFINEGIVPGVKFRPLLEGDTPVLMRRVN